MAQPARKAWLFVIHAAACAADDAWGCAMSGQIFANGEGVAPDADRARAQFSKACLLAKDPSFEA